MRGRSAGRVFGVAAGLLGLLLLLPAHGQTPIVQPGDVSTPAPTATRAPASLLPTPTLQPTTPAGSAMPVRNPAGFVAGQPYLVRAGDTLLSVALETGLDVDDVPCAVGPHFRMEQPLVIGDTLSIPPANVLCHAVAAGETLASIAALYGVGAEQLYQLAWNDLAGVPMAAVQLEPGVHLRVPLPLQASLAVTTGSDGDGTGEAFLIRMLQQPVNTSPFTLFAAAGDQKPRAVQSGPVPADWPYGSGHFTWPVYGWLSQSYRYDHRAIDVAAQVGTPVTAADRGVVVRAGWNDQGYGRFVIVDHNIDYLTLYAHLDRILVEEGEVVGQGQVVGTVGSTGNSTGPHLHFEIRDFGRLVNPLELLAGE